MSDHSIILDMRSPRHGWFECTAPDDSPCHAVWGCECEQIWDYAVVDDKPTHALDWINNSVDKRHVGRFDNTRCNLTDWYDNQEEDVEGVVRVWVSPVWHEDYVTFAVTGARAEVTADATE